MSKSLQLVENHLQIGFTLPFNTQEQGQKAMGIVNLCDKNIFNDICKYQIVKF